MCGANAASFDANDPEGIGRVDSLVGRRTGIEEQNAVAPDAKRKMRMTVEHGVYVLVFKRAVCFIDGQAPRTGMAVNDSDPRIAGFEQNPVSQFLS